MFDEDKMFKFFTIPCIALGVLIGGYKGIEYGFNGWGLLAAIIIGAIGALCGAAIGAIAGAVLMRGIQAALLAIPIGIVGFIIYFAFSKPK